MVYLEWVICPQAGANAVGPDLQMDPRRASHGISLPSPTLGSTQGLMECHYEHLAKGSGPVPCTQIPGTRCEANQTAHRLPPAASAHLHAWSTKALSSGQM